MVSQSWIAVYPNLPWKGDPLTLIVCAGWVVANETGNGGFTSSDGTEFGSVLYKIFSGKIREEITVIFKVYQLVVKSISFCLKMMFNDFT